MENWEFLIQREGDRGWRPIKTGNLQLKEGIYRIVANGNENGTQIHTRVTYQNLGTKFPQRKTQARHQNTNARGLVVIIPFTNLEPGIWQFVCSGGGTDRPTWHHILKLRVLARQPINSSPIPSTEKIATNISIPPAYHYQTSGDVTVPTEPLIPMETGAQQENWENGLDRLLEQLEQDSLKPRQPRVTEQLPNLLQIKPIVDPPLRLINIERSNFARVIPGHRLTINGTCNLELFSADLIETVKISKLLLCLRNPHTAEIISSIEQPIPSKLEIFAFSGQLQLPSDTTTSLLMGEVNLYDRHNIQLGSAVFTVTLDLDPIDESELSFLELLEDRTDSEHVYPHLDRLTEDLKVPSASAHTRSETFSTPTPSIPPTDRLMSYPSVPVEYRRESMFAEHSNLVRVASSKPRPPENPSQRASVERSGDLDLTFDPPSIDSTWSDRHWDTLEVVVD